MQAASAWILAACFVWAQNPGDTKSTVQLDFSKDPCGNPMMESQLWRSIGGWVSRINDDQTIVLALPDSPKVLRVRLAGIAPKPHGMISLKAKEHLTEISLNKPVEVLVNPDEWTVSDKRPKEVTGAVYLTKGTSRDLALTLLSEGLARFKLPRPYTISSYTACQYRGAEAEAQSQKIGLWK